MNGNTIHEWFIYKIYKKRKRENFILTKIFDKIINLEIHIHKNKNQDKNNIELVELKKKSAIKFMNKKHKN